MNTGINYLAYRVRHFSFVAMLLSPLVAAYHFTIYGLNGFTNSFNLGFGLAMLIWTATFIYPRKLASHNNTNKQKLAAFGLFCVALLSALIWFPINAAITRP